MYTILAPLLLIIPLTFVLSWLLNKVVLFFFKNENGLNKLLNDIALIATGIMSVSVIGLVVGFGPSVIETTIKDQIEQNQTLKIEQVSCKGFSQLSCDLKNVSDNLNEKYLVKNVQIKIDGLTVLTLIKNNIQFRYSKMSPEELNNFQEKSLIDIIKKEQDVEIVLEGFTVKNDLLGGQSLTGLVSNGKEITDFEEDQKILLLKNGLNVSIKSSQSKGVLTLFLRNNVPNSDTMVATDFVLPKEQPTVMDLLLGSSLEKLTFSVDSKNDYLQKQIYLWYLILVNAIGEDMVASMHQVYGISVPTIMNYDQFKKEFQKETIQHAFKTMVTSFAQKWMYKLNIDKKESNEKVLTFIQNLFENKLGVIEVKPKITIKEILFGSVKH